MWIYEYVKYVNLCVRKICEFMCKQNMWIYVYAKYVI